MWHYKRSRYLIHQICHKEAKNVGSRFYGNLSKAVTVTKRSHHSLNDIQLKLANHLTVE